MSEDFKTKQKKNYVYHEKGANVSVITIESHHCWMCGEAFNNQTPEQVKTMHHSLPQELMPVRNIKIPVCRGCHGKIHNAQGMQPHDKNRIKKKMDAFKNQYENLKKNLESIGKELSDDKHEE